MYQVALQLYSVREDAEKDLAGTLRQVKAMGYAGVELAGLHGRTVAEMKALLQENGLALCSAHVPYTAMMADPDGVLGAYAEAGCRYVAVPYLTEEYHLGAEKGEEAVAGMRMLGEKAAALGMTLLYHNHDFEFKKIDGEYKLDLLYKFIPHQYLQTELDTCWIKVAGEDPVAYIKKYTGRAPIVHLKDYYMRGQDTRGAYKLIGIESDEAQPGGDAFEFRPLGAGVQDVPALLVASANAGAQWVVVEQDEPTPGKSALQCARESVAYLKSL